MARDDVEARTSKKYVHTFIFSMRTGTPIEKLHVITKFIMIAFMSILAIYMFDIPPLAGGPDLIGLGLLLLLVFVLLVISGTTKYLVNSYLVLALPVLLGEFIWWVFFNLHQPGATTTFYWWPGFIPVGLSTVVLVGVFAGVYYRTRGLFRSLVPALLLWYFSLMPEVLDSSQLTTWLKVPIGGVAGFSIPVWTVVIAFSKVLGFAVLIYTSFLFLLTTRDVEIAGAMRQLRLSFRKAFFIALMFRNLNTLLLDYEDIKIAQTARAANVIRKSIFSRIADLAHLSIPLVATMIKRSTEMGVALYARGFEASTKMTEYKETKGITSLDVTVVAILTAFLIYVVVLGHTVTSIFVR